MKTALQAMCDYWIELRPEYWRRLFLLTLVHYLFVRFSLFAAGPIAGLFPPVWSPIGLGIAVLVLQGLRFWPGLMLGAFAAYEGMPGSSGTTALILTLSQTGEITFVAYLLRSVAEFRPDLNRFEDVLAFVSCTALGAMAGASIGVTGAWFARLPEFSGWVRFWMMWWLGSLTAALVVAPAILAWMSQKSRLLEKKNYFEFGCLIVLLVVAAGVAFRPGPVYDTLLNETRKYLLFPFAIWSAIRFGSRGAGSFNFAAGSVAVGSMWLHRQEFLFYPLEQERAMLQAFLIVLSVTSLVLGGVIAENQRAGKRLEQQVAERTQALESANRRLRGEITERHRKEEELLKFQQRLRFHFDRTPLGAVMWDPQFCIIDWNPAAERIFGYTREEALGMHAQVIVPEKSRSQVGQVLQDLLQRKGGLTNENLNLTKEGRLVDCQWFNTPLVGSDGKTIGVASLVLDITEKKKADALLRESEWRHRTLVENVPVAVYRCLNDEHWTMVHLSSLIDEITGYPEAEFINNQRRTFTSIIHPDDRKMVWDKIQKGLQETSRYFVEYRILHREGSIRWVRDKGRGELGKPGEIAWLDGVLFDVTHEKMIEEESIKSGKIESIGVLAGGIAHDFNNLIMGIHGNIELAELPNITEDKRKIFLKNATSACDRARSLSQQLLTFAKGGAPLKQPVNVKKLVVDAVKYTLGNSPAVVEIYSDPDVRMIEADEGQVMQVITNLLINADQAMPAGGRLLVSLHNAPPHAELQLPDSSRPYVRLSVEDHGIGIDPQNLSRIFDPYFTTKKKGSGLGLATTYSIVKRHDGLVVVNSELGKGTVFHVYFPAMDAPAEEPEILPLLAGLDSGDSLRVLCMDDEPEIRVVLKECFARLGFAVTLAKDGDEAVRCYRKALEEGSRFTVVTLDLTIPGSMGGKETLEKIRQMNPEVTAVVISGYSDDPVMADYASHHFSAALIKPFTFEKLRHLIGMLNLPQGNPGRPA